MKLKSAVWKILAALFAFTSLTGCGALGGFGKGLGDVFKGIKLP